MPTDASSLPTAATETPVPLTGQDRRLVRVMR
jgi:hypothetical protein